MPKLKCMKPIRGGEFVRRVRRLGRARGVTVTVRKARGKGSQGVLNYGDHWTTVQDTKRDLPIGTLRAMCRQLGIDPEDL